MMKFLRALLNAYDSNNGNASFKSPVSARYDEDGNFIDPKVGHLKDKELTINAEKARIMMSKAAEDVKLAERRKIFQKIHSAILKGKTKIRLENYHVKQETLTYFAELGYTIATVTPPANGTGFNPPFLEDEEESEVTGAPRAYFYYNLSWGPAVDVAQEATDENGVVIRDADATGVMLLESLSL